MAEGGIYDHLGGGFHRYSTERTWTVPHFEKMLYDNAQLVELYADAYRADPKPLYKRVVAETLAFVEREMTSPEGAFYSALDADSEDEEGEFYVWTAKELDDVLGGDEDARRCSRRSTAPTAAELRGEVPHPAPAAAARRVAKELKLTEANCSRSSHRCKTKLFDGPGEARAAVPRHEGADRRGTAR